MFQEYFSRFNVNNYDCNDKCNDYYIDIVTENSPVLNTIQNGFRYVAIPHNTEYSVRLSNKTFKRCNVELFIDKEFIGKWRINEYSSIVIERPSKSMRKFTFVKENTHEADMGNVMNGSFNNGLIEAKFIPEAPQINFNNNNYKCRNTSMKNSSPMAHTSNKTFCNNTFGMSSGATILGNRSNQKYGSASKIDEDMANIVTKKIRLVVNENPVRYRKYVPLNTKDDDIPLSWGNSYEDVTPPRIDRMDGYFL